jgi:hypothetical protein
MAVSNATRLIELCRERARWRSRPPEALRCPVSQPLRRTPHGILATRPLAGEPTRSRVFGGVGRMVVAPFVLLHLPIREAETVHVLALRHGRRDWRAKA